MRWRRLLLSVTLGTAASVPSTNADPYFLGLGDLPGGDVYSLANGISADGTTVVGMSRVGTLPGGGHAWEAFRWTATSGIQGLGDLGTGLPRSNARAVSANGAVVVGQADPDGPVSSAPFRWTSSTGVTALADSSGASSGQAYDVSADGLVVFGVWSVLQNQAFRWTTESGVVGLGWLPSDPLDSFAFGCASDGSVACGISNSGSDAGVEPIVWSAPKGLIGLGDVPGGIFYAIAWDVSGDGSTVVGSARSTLVHNEPFLWTEAGGFVLPETTHGADFSSEFFAVSADGSVAAGYSESGAMIWDAVHGMRDLADVLENELGLSLTGWTLGPISGISADGLTVVGSGTNPDGHFEGWVAGLSMTGSTAAMSPREGPSELCIRIAGPNPFGSETALLVMSDEEETPYRANVLRVDGRHVRHLSRGVASIVPSLLRWDGRDDSGARAASGIYVVAIESSRDRAATKVLLRR